MSVIDLYSKASIGVLKRVSGGYLNMGSRFHPREVVRRAIYVSEFDMGHAPVTVQQYAAFLNSGGVSEERWWNQDGWAWLQGQREGWGRENRWLPDGWERQKQRPYHPIVGVTWYEARAYCAWVGHELKRTARLPMEDEWEYAARGEDGRPFPWGDDFDPSLSNTMEAQLYDTVEVTSVTGDLSPFGLADMAGNVQEWTGSVYIPQPGEVFPVQDLRVVRGGSFNDTAFGSRTSYRRAYPPTYFYQFLGFRVVVETVR